jgi:hypothetical protein
MLIALVLEFANSIRQFDGERRSLALDAIDVDFPVDFVALDPAGALGGSSFRLARESGCK